MAPVEPARAAAVAVVATVGVVLAALAVTKFKSKSKKQSSEHAGESSVKEEKSPDKACTHSQDGELEGIREKTAVKALASGKSLADVVGDSKGETKPLTGNGSVSEESAISTTEKSQVSVLGNPDSSEHLIEQVYKSEDEPAEQTLVSFAEIKFSPTKSEGNNSAHLDSARPVPKPVVVPRRRREASPVNSSVSDSLTSVGVSESYEKIQPEQSSSFEAISVSAVRRNLSDTDKGTQVHKESSIGQGNGQNSDGSTSEASKSDTSFETVEVSQDGTVDWSESGKCTSSKADGSGEVNSMQRPRSVITGVVGRQQTRYGVVDETFTGAAESMALCSEEEDDGAVAGVTSSLPVDAGGDASFVLLDVATAPSNCKPDLDIVDSVPLDQLELQKSVGLHCLKSPGSDNGGGEEDSRQQLQTSDESQMVEPEPYPNLSEDDISEALSVASANPEALEFKHAETLVEMLSTKDLELQEKILAVIVKVATFTKNQDNFRKAGCIPRLIYLLKTHSTAVQVGVLPLSSLLTSLINAVTNLAVNTPNNAEMQACVPPLVDLILTESSNDSVRMSSLQALTNLSVTTDHHPLYTRIIQQLYGLIDSSVPSIQLQALKVMVNLSCNKDMIPHLLAAKAPDCLLSLLEPDTSESVVLRWTTLLANIMHTVKEQQLSAANLPAGDKAASPETMYIALYGLNTSGQLRNKVFVLSKHPCEDIRYQAARIYSGLMK